jgi:hypothetical protein
MNPKSKAFLWAIYTYFFSWMLLFFLLTEIPVCYVGPWPYHWIGLDREYSMIKYQWPIFWEWWAIDPPALVLLCVIPFLLSMIILVLKLKEIEITDAIRQY